MCDSVLLCIPPANLGSGSDLMPNLIVPTSLGLWTLMTLGMLLCRDVRCRPSCRFSCLVCLDRFLLLTMLSMVRVVVMFSGPFVQALLRLLGRGVLTILVWLAIVETGRFLFRFPVT